MQDDMNDESGKFEAAAQQGLDRAERYRERMRRAQMIAAKKARMEASGGRPGEEEAARMVAEFHARGGQITPCPPADGMLKDAEESRHTRRGAAVAGTGSEES